MKLVRERCDVQSGRFRYDQSDATGFIRLNALRLKCALQKVRAVHRTA
jgi:hypothetical protein